MDYLITLASDPVVWVALATLIAMEVVLGIDNLLFIAIITSKLPEEQQSRARKIGIGGALILRLALLGTIAWIVQLTTPVLVIDALGVALSWRDIILVVGGGFLVWKATREIHEQVDPEPTSNEYGSDAATLTFGAAVSQILIVDAVFSIDSIITAVGMTPHVPIMVIAILTAVITMLIAADPLSEFIKSNPTLVMLALGFLLLIGTMLVAEGFGVKVPKGYIYAAMGFSIFVELLNMRARNARRRKREEAAVEPAE
ncbi:MAG: TerC family protein [Pseudomonadota bacterium]